MQGKLRPAGEFAVDANEVLHGRYLGRQDNFVARQAPGHSLLGTLNGRGDKGLAHHGTGIPGVFARGVFIHKTCQNFLVETAPVHANTHRTVIAQGCLHHGPKLGVALGPTPDIAWVDAVLRERHRTLGHLGQKLVAIEMKVAHQRHGAVHLVELLANRGHGPRGLKRIDRNAHDLGSGKGQVAHLNGCANGIGGIGIGHGLHHHRGPASHWHLGVVPAHHHAVAGPTRGRAAGKGRRALLPKAGISGMLQIGGHGLAQEACLPCTAIRWVIWVRS
nr:hypothetical protein NCPCFENI_01138 [Cupriavidus sp.]